MNVSVSDAGYKLSERRSIELFGDKSAIYDPFAGIPVSSKTAMTHSAVYRCVSLIASTIASCRAYVQQIDRKDRSIIPIYDHPSVNVMTRSPNFDMGLTPYSFIENLLVQYLLHGDGFAQVKTNGRFQANKLIPLPYHWVDVEWDDFNRKIYKVYPDGKYSRYGGKLRRPDEVLQADEMIHMADLLEETEYLHGESRIKKMAQEVSLGLASTRHAGRYFRHGRPLGFVSVKEWIKEGDKGKLQEEWSEMHSVPWSVGVLANEAKWVPLSLNANEVQLIETREFQIADIARFFGVPSFLLGLANKEGYKSAEQLFRSFVTSTVGPIITKLEQELRLKLFTRDESFTYQICFERDDLQRGDTQAMAEALERQLRHGVLTVNEWRLKMGMPKLTILDDKGQNIGDIPLTMASQLATLKDVVEGKALKANKSGDGSGGSKSSSDKSLVGANGEPLVISQAERFMTAKTMIDAAQKLLIDVAV